MKGPQPKPVSERFWPKVDKSGECWRWTAFISPKGYGRFTIATGNAVMAHRLSYELSVGPIPDGMQLDHTCYNRSCVNPSHLRPVTPIQNSQNRKGAAKHGTSGYRGVTWIERSQKWQAKAIKDGRAHYAGLFTDVEEAAVAAEALRNRLYGTQDAA